MNEVKETGGRKQLLAIRVSPERAEQYREAARVAGIATAAWLTMAANSYLAGWRDPERIRKARAKREDPVKRYANGWPQDRLCPFPNCGKSHDPAPHPWWPGEWEKQLASLAG